jgi:lipoate-protein ligase A
MAWLLLESGPGEAAFNMAMDEALLLSMPRLRTPVLRFYSWTEKAASFGYFQKYAEMEKLTHLRPLVRRPTAGGLVPHDADWTYSLAVPNNHPWYSLRAPESYRRIHEWIQSAFKEAGVATELAPAPRRAGLGQCFVGYERYDLLWHGLKIAGAAQRRTRDGLLIQGSVQPGSIRVERVQWQNAMKHAGKDLLADKEQRFAPDQDLIDLADQLRTHKYCLAAYNSKR